MTYEDTVNRFYDLVDRLSSAGTLEVFLPPEHCVYMSTSSGPSSQPSLEIFDWLAERGLRHGCWQKGWWVDNWPQIDDADPRVKILFNILDYEIVTLFKLTYG